MFWFSRGWGAITTMKANLARANFQITAVSQARSSGWEHQIYNYMLKQPRVGS